MRCFSWMSMLGVVMTTSPCWAVPKSPVSLQAQLGLAYQPPCSVCHTSKGVPNSGDVDAPFGLSMIKAGLRPNDRPALNAALAQLEANRIDSDGDGLSDIAELRLGLDPSVGDVSPIASANAPTDEAVAATTSTTPSSKGCGVGPTGATGGGGVLVALGLLVIARRARRAAR